MPERALKCSPSCRHRNANSRDPNPPPSSLRRISASGPACFANSPIRHKRRRTPMALTPTPAKYYALLRHDLSAFSQRAFDHLNRGTPYLHNWHLELLAAKLEACRRGRITRLIICVPPRSLKSHCASVALPAWWLGHDPTAQLLCVSYAQ